MRTTPLHPSVESSSRADQPLITPRQYGVVAMALGIGISLTLFLFLRVQVWQQERLQAIFATSATEAIDTLQTSIQANLETLHHMRSFYTASDGVSREEFQTFVSDTLARRTNIQALEWAPRVSDSERVDYETLAQNEGYPDFRFIERDSEGQSVTAQQREEYFPIYYVEPLAGNEAAFGFDLRSNPTRWETMQRARDSGQEATTPRVRLVQETGDQFGVIVYLPVYQGQERPATIDDRQQALEGFVLAVFRIGDMVDLALKGSSQREIHIYLEDESAPPEEQFLYLYEPHGEGEGNHDEVAELEVMEQVEVGGRTWRLRAVPTTGFVAAYQGNEKWLVLGSGLLITLLISGYLLSSFRKNAEIAQQNTRLARRSVQLQVAAEVARDAASSTQDMDNLLNGVVEMIRARFGFYHAGIFLVDEVSGYAVLRAAASEAAPAMLAQGHKLKIGETGIVGNVTATGQPRIALDVGTDAVHFKNPHLPNTRSEMALPLKVGEEIIGALDVQSEEAAAFDEEDIAALATLADQIAIAIQNVRSYARMREVDNLKTRFIANMSHELRTPLNAIINFADFMLKRRFGELTEKQESLQQRIMANGEHLLGLINDILDLSKIEAGKMELMHEEVHLKPLLDGVMSTAVGLTKEKGIELSLQVDPEGLPPVWADETRVRQVMLNLLSNAAKFTSTGGQVTVRAGVQNGHVAVSVIDTGIGIAPEHQALVFEEFRQVDSDLSREYQGTGLGLPICKKLIEMHGGKLTLRSTVGEGSTFTFTLPAMVGKSQKREVEPYVPSTTISLDKNHRVVVVDDDGDAQTILGHTLEAAGWQVHPVLDSREAHEVVRRVRPHVVVLDLKMPYLDGWAVLNQLRADPSLAGLPVVVCSIVDREQGQMGMISSVQGWLVKPVERETLLAQVQKVAMTPAQVLVVDDDPDARLVVSSILEQSGWQVAEVSDGTEALAYLEEKQPDLMVLDLMMPHVDGFEVLRRMNVHPEWGRIPVLVLTAKDLTKEEQSWLAQHTHGHFRKAAFPITEFPAIVRSLVQYIPPEKS